MQKLWEFTAVDRAKTWEQHMLRFHYIELMSWLTRLWNFNQTGNVKALAFKAFTKMGIYQSITNTGWPCFKDIAILDLVQQPNRPLFSVPMKNVPLDDKTGEVITSADASLAHHYGPELADVRILRSVLRMSLPILKFPLT